MRKILGTIGAVVCLSAIMITGCGHKSDTTVTTDASISESKKMVTSADSSTGETFVDEYLVINKADLSKDTAAIYSKQADDTFVEVLAAVDADGDMLVSLNHHEGCENENESRAVQRGNKLVCQGCNAEIPLSAIGNADGSGLLTVISDDAVTPVDSDELDISMEYLADYADLF